MVTVASRGVAKFAPAAYSSSTTKVSALSTKVSLMISTLKVLEVSPVAK
jgi:hypothetical protein